jgi:PAS domain S-box-containing protein
VNDAIFINDRESGAILDVNDVACEMYGYTREELLSVDIGTISSGESSYTQQDAVDKIAEVATGKPQLFEWKAKHKNGNLFWVEVNMKRAAIGGADGVVVVVRDITERKRAEAALRESEQRFQNAFEHAAIGMALVAPDGRWVKVNRSLCSLVGYSEEELLTKKFQDITHPDDLETDLKFVRQMLAKEIRTYQMEKRYVHKSGRIVWISLSVSLVRDSEDKPLYFISQIEDITDRKQAEESLKKSEERLSKFFMVAPIGIAVTSLPDGRLLDINSEFETILGIDRSEAVGKTTTELGIWLDPKDRENVLSRVRSEGKVKDLDLQVRAKQGNIVTQRFSAVPIEIDGRSYLLSAFEDVTRRRKAEEELKQYHVHLEELVEARTSELSAANTKLKELDRLKSMFIASMSHELRTPLNSIIGFTGMTLQGMSGELNDEQKDNLTRAYHSAKHLLDLISDVIDISKIEAGRVEAYPEGFFLRKLVDDAVATVVPQLRDKALTIEVDVPPDTYLTTDRRRLLQCLINFLSNAVKFSDSGRVIVASRKTDGLVSLSVSDTGIGIAGEDIHRLFEPFERLETRLRVKAGGTGLGLYLTKKLAIDVLRGDVSVESIEGQGSTFTITFPEDIGQTGKPSTDQGGGGIP